jgi:transcriptional regulator with XRE-family HTH domain
VGDRDAESVVGRQVQRHAIILSSSPLAQQTTSLCDIVANWRHHRRCVWLDGRKQGSASKECPKGGSPAAFRAFLRETRRAKGLSIRQLAKMAGVSSAYLSQVETGTRGVPSPIILKRLARPLSVTPIRLFQIAGYIGYPPEPENAETLEIEAFLRQENLRFTLEGKPITHADIDALIEFLRKRHAHIP